jgi:hypothetical protein
MRQVPIFGDRINGKRSSSIMMIQGYDSRPVDELRFTPNRYAVSISELASITAF